MKKKIPGLVVTHCVGNRKRLVGHNLSSELNHSLNVVKECINKIKTRSLKDRLFRKLCHDNDKDFELVLLHTDLFWLPKGTCMSCFYSLYDLEIEELFSVINCQLAEALKPLKNDIFYLAEIFTIMNKVKKKL